MYHTLSPAYGRDYKKAADVVADWEKGKDFVIEDFVDPYCGKPVSLSDVKDAWKGHSVKIRFDKLKKVVILKV
jgi:hypothetical protein